MPTQLRSFCTQTLEHNQKSYKIINPHLLSKAGFFNLERLPFSILILLEQILRNLDGYKFKDEDVKNLSHWDGKSNLEKEIPFMPSRVVLQDFTGVPLLVDLASLRSALGKNNLNPDLINPLVPVDLIIDHSVQVDAYGSNTALDENLKHEFSRNQERYEFLKWGQQAFKNFRVFPPGVGIIHQVNLEYLSPLVQKKEGYLLPDTLVGTDSHTTMINGLGVLGWGVGGIEAESAMLGQPIYMKIPEVIGFQLHGQLNPNVTATDLVLRITEILRKKGVVEKFVEFYGSGLSQLSLPDRATIGNMAPEYGATMGFFPVDAETIRYLRQTGRDQETVELAEKYFKALKMFRTDSSLDPIFSDVLELDLSTVRPSIAGPKRPQDRIDLTDSKSAWHKALQDPIAKRGFELKENQISATAKVEGKNYYLSHGSVVIAAITSCTNTSNPSVLLNAGLLSKKSVEKGLNSKPWVKTSLAPGSRVVTDYLSATGLQQAFDALGFHTVGYGCTTCIGNSGPLPEKIVQAIREKDLVACSVLSGNRNFEGRIHAEVKANFLASPPLVVAYALAGTMDIDFDKEPLGQDKQGKPVFLKDLWPSPKEVQTLLGEITPEMYRKRYDSVLGSSERWMKVSAKGGKVYSWQEDSTYIQNPPFFMDIEKRPETITAIKNARVLLKLGDSVTTDHISPAGSFQLNSPAGKFLTQHQVKEVDFNSYGSRRGNDRIMVRGTFANTRIKNLLVPGTEGGITKSMLTQEVMPVYDAAMLYKQKNIPSIVIAGAEYGSGSSRDWAAKGPYLLGVSAVLAVSFERIHRSNLIGMGILPVQFLPSQSAESLQFTGEEEYSILGLTDDLKPQAELILEVNKTRRIPILSRLDTEVEIDYYRKGGILHSFLRNLLKKAG